MSTIHEFDGNSENMVNPEASGLLKALRVAGSALALLSAFVSAPTGAFAASQKTFASPEQAGDALAASWRRGSKADILEIFGPSGLKLVSSGDAIADKEAREKLTSEYDAQHKIEKNGEQKALLILGKDEFPFPIPLVRQAKVWRFDTKAGEEEILNRRIGRNELDAIEFCRAYVESQREYADRLGNGLHEYAMQIASTGDRHNGLYWPAKEGEEESPFGPLVASAAAEGYNESGADMLAPYHGYYYKILTRQGANASGGATDYIANGHMTGGFALVAFPAKYGNSGIMTFIVNQNGIVFEKNLGMHTKEIARQMTQYDPDKSWKIPN